MTSTARLALALALMLAAVEAFAQAPSPLGQGDHHHPLHDFYRTWQRPDGLGSCCNARIVHPNGGETGDCEPARAEVRAGQWWVWVRQIGRWLPVPDEKFIRERNPTVFDAHLCFTPANGIMCFSPPDTGG